MRSHCVFFAAVSVLAFWASSCGGGPSGGDQSSVAVPITVSISPTSASVPVGLTQQFTVSLTNTQNTSVTWEINNLTGGNTTFGTISTSGLYTAPKAAPNPPVVTVLAISQADPTKSASASVTITQAPSSPNQTAQASPIKLGTSGGNTLSCCSGTLGSLVTQGGSLYILGTNDVLANSNQAPIGVEITQPGPADNGCNPGTPVANLSQFVQLPQGGTQASPKTGTVDAALAQIISGAVDTSGTILELGTASSDPAVPNPSPPASSTTTPEVGMGVAKIGRTSGLTCSSIQAINSLVDVPFSTACNGGTTFYVEFDNQIVISGGNFGTGGDSGSLVVNSGTAQAVGLLYGGDSTSAVANPIGAVLPALADSKGNIPTVVGGPEHAIACPAVATAAPANAQVSAPLASSELARATEVSTRYATRLMANPTVSGVVVGHSHDAPGDAAVIIYVKSLGPAGAFPAQLDGVRTRIVPISAMQGRTAHSGTGALSEPEVARVAAIKQARAKKLLRTNPAIFGVGVGASDDSPGEAALVLFVDKNMAYSVPVVLGGARTVVVRSDRFRTWGSDMPLVQHSCSALR